MANRKENETIFDQYLQYSGRTEYTPAPMTSGTRMLTDLPYLSDDGHVRLGDLHLPVSAPDKLPVIVDVHGGGWIYGSKEINRAYASYLASGGFGVFVFNYTSAENADLPNQVKDVLAALTWVWNNAEQFNLDRNWMYLCGDSAGAHLALLAYIVSRSESLRMIFGAEPTEASVKAFGLVSPVTDLHFFADSILPVQRKFRARLFGDDYAQSPLRYCASIADVLRSSTDLPPVYLVSSEDDFFRNQSVTLHHTLNRRGVENRFRYYPALQNKKLPHCFPVHHPDYAESQFVSDEMLKFFREHV